MNTALALVPAPVRAIGLLLAAVLLEWARVLELRTTPWPALTLLLGGLALCLLSLGWSPDELGLGRSRLPERLLGGLALAGILLLPAAVRWAGGPALAPPFALAAVVVSVGEEVAFRGAAFVALERAFGPAVAVVGTTAGWTAAHVLSHPLQFLPAVAAAGLLLGAWRWALRDLVGPIIGHVIADLAL
ncbi:MAG TPA: CPBP family intramembrane glutamic endopeptidase [Terriglobales bacterium]|nr:CPBP family intramembrane glutamic endopeptidase [Terriglobales bacterium]